MLRALLERGVVPDLVVGTSVGAINGAAVASDPTIAMVQRLAETWADIERSDVFAGSLLGRLATLARTKTHLHGNDALRATLTEALPIALIEDLPVRFECVAASIEGAAEHWFTAGPLVDAVLASAAVPGILPPVEVGGQHFIDGGIVNSIPVDRAVQLGATRIFVMHVGRLDRPLEPPRWPWEVALVAFEIARRHRFLGDLASLPDSRRGARAADRSARGPEVQRPLGAALPRVGGRGGEHRARARRLARVSRRARALMRVPLSAGAARGGRAARARRRGLADRRRAAAGRDLRGAVAAVRRTPPGPRARARADLGRRARHERRGVPAAGARRSTAPTTPSCAGSSARSRAARCAWRACR